MKRVIGVRALILMLSIIVGMLFCFGVYATADMEEHEFNTQTLIVEIEDNQVIDDSYGESTRIEVGAGLYILVFDTLEETEKAFYMLDGKPNIKSVETDRVTQVASLTDGGVNIDGDMVSSFDSYKDQYLTGELETVTIALIDTNVTLVEDRILERITVLDDAMGGEEGVKEQSIYKEHGNTLAKLLLSCTNNEVKILPIAAINEEGKGTVLSAYLAIQAAIDADVDIINLSFGGEGTSNILVYAIQEAKNNGIVVVAASGNNGGDVADYTPGNIETVITVGAIDENDMITDYSNTGNGIDLVAYDTYVSGEIYGQGTSISATYVSAALALFIQETEERGTDKLEQILYQTAMDLGEEGVDNIYGNGALCLQKEIVEDVLNSDETTAEDSLVQTPTSEELEQAYQQSVLAYMTTDPYSFYWSASLGNQGKGVVQEEGSIYWCSRGNAASNSYSYLYNNVGWFAQIRSESGDEVVIYVDDDESIYGAEKLVSGYIYSINCLPSATIFQAIYESGYDYQEFCSGILTVEFDGYIRIHKGGTTVYGPYDLRVSSQLNTLLDKMTSLGFSTTSKTSVQENFKDKIIYIAGSDILKNNKYRLDLNGIINGEIKGSLSGYATADVYIDGGQVVNDVTDYYVMHTEGTIYKIDDFQLSEGLHIVGETSFAGNLTEDTGIFVEIETNAFSLKYYANDGDVESDNYYVDADSGMIISTSLGENLQTIKYGTTITTYSASTLGLNKLGYQFADWKTKDGVYYEENTSYNALDFLDTDGNTLKDSYGGVVEMYAQWKANQYTIKFNANGGVGEEMESLILLYDEEVELTKNTYTRDGFSFIGWNTETDGTGIKYKDEEIIKNLTYKNEETITLYATWDEAPQIEVCDIYVTTKEVELGVVTEEYLMEFAEAIDKEDGILCKEANYSIDDGKETSFYVKDYRSEDFEGIANGMVTITYEAIDSVGNRTIQLANVYIVNSDMEVPDSERNQLRFIDAEYADTLAENSIWNIDQDYRDLLDMTLSNMQYKVDSAIEVESEWGYSAIQPGSGIFLEEPMKTWILDSEQIGQMRDNIINYGFS